MVLPQQRVPAAVVAGIQDVKEGRTDELPKGTVFMCFHEYRPNFPYNAPHHTEFTLTHSGWMVIDHGDNKWSIKPHGGRLIFCDAEGQESQHALYATMLMANNGFANTMQRVYDANPNWFKAQNYGISGQTAKGRGYYVYAKFHVWLDNAALAEIAARYPHVMQ